MERLEILKKYVDSYLTLNSIDEPIIKVLLQYYLEANENTTFDKFVALNQEQNFEITKRFDTWLMSFGFDSLKTLSDNFILHKKGGK